MHPFARSHHHPIPTMPEHLLELPSPRRARHLLPCAGCAAPTDAAHNAVRVLCGACTERALKQPGRFFPVAVQTELLSA